MELALDPVALGGLAGLIALSAWALGRMQSGSVTRTAAPIPAAARHTAAACTSSAEQDLGDAAQSARIATAPTACQQRAIEERRAIFALPVALCELHDQVTSIRRDERVFEQAPAAQDLAVLFARGSEGACRYLGRSGQPTCPGSVNGTCHDGGSCTVSDRISAHRPRPDPAPVLRSAVSRPA